MREYTYDIPGGSLVFTLREGGIDSAGGRGGDSAGDSAGGLQAAPEAFLSRVSGQPAVIDVPGRVGGADGALPGQIENGIPVTFIERKAFLGRKSLRRVSLPGTVREIGDWAFASCSGLREISLPAAELGKGVFQGCAALREIRVTGMPLAPDASPDGGVGAPLPDGSGFPPGAPGVSALLAAIAPEEDAGYLVSLSEAGEEEWLRKYDARILKILSEPDDEGFSRQILCGEEDYGSTDLAAYESGRRMRKAESCMLRLLYDRGLAPDARAEYLDYVLSHLPGSGGANGRMEAGGGGAAEAQGQGETWKMLKMRHAEDAEWCELFIRLGCVTDENRDRLIADLGEEHPELKSRLLKTAGQSAAERFFDSLAL